RMSLTDPRTTTRDSHPAPRRARALTAPFRRAWRWFAHQPLALRVGMVAVAVAGLAVGGFYARSVLQKQDAAREVADGWRDFQESLQKTDLTAMRAALARVQAAAPDDAGAARYLGILAR